MVSANTFSLPICLFNIVHVATVLSVGKASVRGDFTGIETLFLHDREHR